MNRFKFLWKYVSGEKTKLITALVFLTFVSLTSLVYPILLKLMVDKLNKGSGDYNLMMLMISLLGAFSISTVLGYYVYVIMHNLGFTLRNNLRTAFFESLLYRPLSFYKDKQTGELTSRATDDIGKLQPVFHNLVVPLYQNVLFIAGCIVLMLILSIPATLAVLALICIPLPLLMLYSKRVRTLSGKGQAEHASANALMEESLIGIREMKSFLLEKITIGKYKEYLDRGSGSEITSAKAHALSTQAVYFILSMMLLGIFYIGTSKTFSLGWSIGSVIAFYFYAYSVTMAFLTVGRTYMNYQSISGTAGRVVELLGTSTPLSATKVIIEKDIIIKGKIEFQNVVFGYEENKVVINNLSFSLEPDRWLLITGSSGAGKSTIANLLLRFYDAAQGKILIDDKSLAEFSTDIIRKNTGYAGQEPILFHGTIKENVMLMSKDENRFKDVAAICCLEEFIEELTDKENTIIGERGITLSGGQVSRIAIARALMGNPPILLLDEANAMVDSETEKRLWGNIYNERKNKTTIIISHHSDNIPSVYQKLELK